MTVRNGSTALVYIGLLQLELQLALGLGRGGELQVGGLARQVALHTFLHRRVLVLLHLCQTRAVLSSQLPADCHRGFRIMHCRLLPLYGFSI